jgi:hypothetical protein
MSDRPSSKMQDTLVSVQPDVQYFEYTDVRCHSGGLRQNQALGMHTSSMLTARIVLCLALERV